MKYDEILNKHDYESDQAFQHLLHDSFWYSVQQYG